MHCLSGHDDTVASILTQATDPQVCAWKCAPSVSPVHARAGMRGALYIQVITGSHDKTIRLWDIRTLKQRTMATLTYHKKSVPYHLPHL